MTDKWENNSAHNKILRGVLAMIKLVKILNIDVNIFYLFKILHNNDARPIVLISLFEAKKGKDVRLLELKKRRCGSRCKKQSKTY
jgi:hypothetical protein